MPLSATAVLRLRRVCAAMAVALVPGPNLVALAIGVFQFDPGDGIVAIAQTLGAGGDTMFARTVASATRCLVEWWFLLMVLGAFAGSLLMVGVALTERSLAMQLRIGWCLLFLGLFIALSPCLAAAAMLVFSWLFLRRPRTFEAGGADADAATAAPAAERGVHTDGRGD